MRQPKLTIANRTPLQARTLTSVEKAGAEAGAYVTGVYDRLGRLDEIYLWKDGEIKASVFRPKEGGLAVWRRAGSRRVANVQEAVELGLGVV